MNVRSTYYQSKKGVKSITVIYYNIVAQTQRERNVTHVHKCKMKSSFYFLMSNVLEGILPFQLLAILLSGKMHALMSCF